MLSELDVRHYKTRGPREGASVTELTGQVALSSWPEGTRLICRRERPHPGAQLSFTDVDGHHLQCFITGQQDADIAALEVSHRQHARVEDRVKTLRATGAGHLPFHWFQADAAWLEFAVLAYDIVVWTQLLNLDGEHSSSEPKPLSYRILHVAGQITRHARRTTLHLLADWPWAAAILRAFKPRRLNQRRAFVHEPRSAIRLPRQPPPPNHVTRKPGGSHLDDESRLVWQDGARAGV